jgi:putative DNA methylase
VKKKLIEVALPLEAINRSAAEEKAVPRRGHPQTIHLWWARRPLAACRAVLFASIVDDPSSNPDQFPTHEAQNRERQRLFRLMEDLATWEKSGDARLLARAKEEMLRCVGSGGLPAVWDPFCGGGSIPLEAQRLGLTAHASDLNPVAVLITKSLIEIPSRFSGLPAVNPAATHKIHARGIWAGARGLADDIRYYGRWLCDRAEERIGALYPTVHVAAADGGGDVAPLAWFWARTIECPNPACNARIPVVRSFILSSGKGKQSYAHPELDYATKTIRFRVRTGDGSPMEGTRQRGLTTCLFCGNSINDATLRLQALARGLGIMPMATVVPGPHGRVYLSPDYVGGDQVEMDAAWLEQPLPDNARWFSPPSYGLLRFQDLFTPRQVASLAAFSDLIVDAREQALGHAASRGAKLDDRPLSAGGEGASAYSDAIAVYLSLALSRLATYNNTICHWNVKGGSIQSIFSRQAIPMSWDFMEICPYADFSGNWIGAIEWIADAVEALVTGVPGAVQQIDATATLGAQSVMVSTDPPYYDNIGYAELSDFFYLWLRRSLSRIYPDLFSTLLVPKAQELIASPTRTNGDKVAARDFFETGLSKAFHRIVEAQDPRFPVTIYYAFKQSEVGDSESVMGDAFRSTGWESMLQGLMSSGLAITGTWPMRTEKRGRMISVGTNALASSIVLVCRRRGSDSVTTRKDFLAKLKKELPPALREMQEGNIAPVDLAQASIGPGMAVFSRYRKVLEADGSPMSVRTALALINQALDEVLSEQESEFDPDTRWALAWFEQHQFDEGLYGEAEVLATAKALSVSHLAEACILHSRAGKVRLLRREELSGNWSPSDGARLTIWEVTQHLIRCLDKKGEKETANLKATIGGVAEIARDLAYRLYALCERKGWAEEAGYYNSLVVAWPSMASEAFELQ